MWEQLRKIEDFILLPAIFLSRIIKREPIHLKCYVCGRPVYSSEETWAGYCNKCGIKRFGQLVKKNARELYEIKWAEERTGRNPAEEVIYKFISNKIEGEKILDVGCGRGTLLNGLNGELVGIDIAKAAYENRRFEFIVADAHNLPLNSEEFDWVICTELVEHVLRPEKVIEECFRILKKKGKVAFSVPNGSGVFGPLQYHLRIYSLEDFKRSLSRYFKIKEALPIGLWLPFITTIFRNKKIFDIKTSERFCTHFIIIGEKEMPC